jgi:hypothetical protein
MLISSTKLAYDFWAVIRNVGHSRGLSILVIGRPKAEDGGEYGLCIFPRLEREKVYASGKEIQYVFLHYRRDELRHQLGTAFHL